MSVLSSGDWGVPGIERDCNGSCTQLNFLFIYFFLHKIYRDDLIQMQKEKKMK